MSDQSIDLLKQELLNTKNSFNYTNLNYQQKNVFVAENLKNSR